MNSRKLWSDDKLFRNLLNNKTKHSYWDTIYELHLRGNAYIFKTAYKLAHSKIEKEQLAGIHVLAQLGVNKRPFDKKILTLCFKLLEQEFSLPILSSILDAIGHNTDELTTTQIGRLSLLKNHSDDKVKLELIFALMAVEHLKAIEILIELSTDKDACIRDWATFAIGTQIEMDNQVIRDALWKKTKDEDNNTKMEAIFGLVMRKDSRIKEVIDAELRNDEVSYLLFDAIKYLNDKAFLPQLYKQLEESKRSDDISKLWLDNLKRCIKHLENDAT